MWEMSGGVCMMALLTSPTCCTRLSVNWVPSILLSSEQSALFCLTSEFSPSTRRLGNSHKPASKPFQHFSFKLVLLLIHFILTSSFHDAQCLSEVTCTKLMLHLTKHSWHRPLFGLCLSRNSSSPSSPGLATTQLRVLSTRGGFFAGLQGKFWTPNSSSQGSVGHSWHVPLFTE